MPAQCAGQQGGDGIECAAVGAADAPALYGGFGLLLFGSGCLYRDRVLAV
ncbi:MAG: hypothetical protein Q4G42_04470 [Neisseria sp.]|nr:hypothetical protein [Neisseria sp.]